VGASAPARDPHEPQAGATSDPWGGPARPDCARVRKRAHRLHEGTITVGVSDTLWATYATEAWSREGRAAVFAVVDHATGEAWADAALRMDRFAAADLLREVCSERFGSVERAVAAGLALRYDGGPLLPQRALPSGDRPPRHRPLARLPLRARDERLRREIHPDAQGAGAVDRTLRQLRAAPAGCPRLRPSLQPRLAARAARLLDPIEARERLRTAQTGWPITPAWASGAVGSVLQARLVADQARLSVPTRVRAESRSRLPDCGG
jgi:hypothetical protein